MRNILLFLLILPVFALGQKKVDRVEMPTKNGEVFYEEIVTVDDNITKSVLYVRALKWFADNFNDSKEVKQVEDKDNGKVIGSGIFDTKANVLTGSFDRISFMVDITVKDGRYRVQFYDIKDKGVDSKGFSSYGYSSINRKYERQLNDDKYMFRGSDVKLLRFIDESIYVFLSSIKNEMEKPTISDDF